MAEGGGGRRKGRWEGRDAVGTSGAGVGPAGHSEWPQGRPSTHSSDTVYLSASGSQATLPIHTPRSTSLSRRPRFLPRMVSRVPPSKGPLRGSICQATGERGEWGSEAGVLAGSRGGRARQTHHLGEALRALAPPATWQVTGAASCDTEPAWVWGHQCIGTESPLFEGRLLGTPRSTPSGHV